MDNPMNILLVDDDVDIIEGMIDAIDFQKLGFEKVFTATNGEQALDYLKNNIVNIMITDIEMPHKSGLDLLSWVRDQNLPIVTIFCTCFSDFNYAKKAVELHSFDYFLKPISYKDLTKKIILAISEVQRLQRLEEYGEYSKSISALTHEIKHQYWDELLRKDTSARMIGQKYSGLAYYPDDRFVLCAYYLTDNESTIAKWRLYGFQNICDEMIVSDAVSIECHLSLFDNSVILVLKQNKNYLRSKFLQTLSEIIECAGENLGVSCSFYYEDGCSADQCRNKFLTLREVVVADVLRRAETILASAYVPPKAKYVNNNAHEWELLIAAGRGREVKNAICQNLDSLCAEGNITRNYLKLLRIDVMQIIHTIMKEKSIDARDVYSDAIFDDLREKSMLSVKNAKSYISYIIDKADQCLNEEQGQGSVVEQIVTYINEHISDELSRNFLSNMVFMNPDYFARLFKKETGVSIGAYILNRRIHMAKKYLLQTDMTINEIALKIGYDNFSYFSHVFREKTGVSPNEYRRSGS